MKYIDYMLSGDIGTANILFPTNEIKEVKLKKDKKMEGFASWYFTNNKVKTYIFSECVMAEWAGGRFA